jgi:Holliday junction resolvase
MANLFGKSNMFATPESVEALQEYAGRFTGPGEAVIAMTLMGMTWNLCSKLYEEAHPEEEEEAEGDDD